MELRNLSDKSNVWEGIMKLEVKLKAFVFRGRGMCQRKKTVHIEHSLAIDVSLIRILNPHWMLCGT
jgi:hypothetical protein